MNRSRHPIAGPRLQTRCWGSARLWEDLLLLLWSRHLFAHRRRDQGVLPGDEPHRSISSDDPSSEGQGP